MPILSAKRISLFAKKNKRIETINKLDPVLVFSLCVSIPKKTLKPASLYNLALPLFPVIPFVSLP
jgi:hypothetical protein